MVGIALLSATLHGCRSHDTGSTQQALAIINARLIDGSGAEPLTGSTVVVVDGRITEAGPSREVTPPANALVLDAEGGTVLPGLIDAHVHVTSALRDDPTAAESWLRSGVTTLVDMGTYREPEELHEDFLRAGAHAPRLLLAGPIFTAPGGYPFVGPRSSAFELASPGDAERSLAPLIDPLRIDHLKLALDRGFTADLDDAGWPVPEPAVLRALTDAAHAGGLRVSAHVTQPGELAAALDAGVDNAAHTPAEILADELLSRAVAAELVLVSTASLWLETPDELAAVQHNLRRHLDLGGRVALGTDAPAFQKPGLPATEMALLGAAGLTPMEILVAATRDAAFAFGRDHDLGRIAPGYVADLVVVAGDPLSDLTALTDVRWVIQAGQVRYRF